MCKLVSYFAVCHFIVFYVLDCWCVDGSPVFTGDMSSLASARQKFSRASAPKPTVSAPHLLVDLPGGKNPVSLLYELYSASGDLTIDDDLTSDTPGVFVAKVQIEKQDFQVC